MNKKEALAYYEAWQEKCNAYNLVLNTTVFDQETIAPAAGSDFRNKMIAYIAGEAHDIEVDPRMKEVLACLQAADLDEDTKRKIALTKRSLEVASALCKEEVVAYREAQMNAFDAWQKAKRQNDYRLFEPHLLKIIHFLLAFAKKRQPDKDAYDLYLDDYEEGMNKREYDTFFNLIKQEISPLVKKIAQKANFLDDRCLHQFYDCERQAKFAKIVLRYLNFETSWGYLGVSEHPFTLGISGNDVRVTTAYNEHNVADSLYSIVHEVGHAFYEHQVKEAFQGTSLKAISSGMHESQSRFLENCIGRRESFLAGLYPALQELYPEELKKVSLHDFYQAVNVSRPSFIRTQADELTYPLHILIRYEIEKMIFAQTADLHHLPELWKEKYHEYLGIEVPNDEMGILQDVHWSSGDFGYFPTYALGSAIAAQLFFAMQKDFDVDEALRTGNFRKITDWLRDHFQQYGARYTFKEAVKVATGEDFNPHYYIDYLKDKFQNLYKL